VAASTTGSSSNTSTKLGNITPADALDFASYVEPGVMIAGFSEPGRA